MEEEEKEEGTREGVTIFGDNATRGIHNYCCSTRHFRGEGLPPKLTFEIKPVSVGSNAARPSSNIVSCLNSQS